MGRVISLKQYKELNYTIEEMMEEPIDKNEMILDIVQDFMRFSIMRNMKKD